MQPKTALAIAIMFSFLLTFACIGQTIVTPPPTHEEWEPPEEPPEEPPQQPPPEEPPELPEYEPEIALTMDAPTGPFVADGASTFSFTVTVIDTETGEPHTTTIDLEAGAALTDGDTKVGIDLTDEGQGTFTADFATTIAGEWDVYVWDPASGASTSSFVTFNPGPVDSIWYSVTPPRGAAPYDTATIYASPIDAYGNPVLYPDADLRCTMNDDPLPKKFTHATGLFQCDVQYDNIGTVYVDIYEANSDVSLPDSVEIQFPSVFLGTPDHGVVEAGDEFTVPLNIYVPQDGDLSYAQISLDYDTILGFEDFVFNPDLFCTETSTYDTVDHRVDIFTVPSTSTLNGYMHVGDLTLTAEETGSTTVDIGETYIYLIDESYLTTWPEYINISIKIPYDVCISINVVNTSGVDIARVRADIEYAQQVFYNAWWECCALTLKWDGTVNTINAEHLKNLDDFTTTGTLTAEEVDLFGRNRKDNCLNLYYVNRFSHGYIGEAVSPGSFPNYDGNPPTESKRTGSVAVAQNAGTRTLAHELGHMLIDNGDEHRSDRNDPSSALVPRDNLMRQSSDASGEDKLTEDQCERIMRGDNPYTSMPG
jgi:hypothetical protein